jgi:hypothetical protein
MNSHFCFFSSLFSHLTHNTTKHTTIHITHHNNTMALNPPPILPILVFASVPLLCKVWWRSQQPQRQHAHAVKKQSSLLQDENDMECEVLAPGLVIMRKALSMESQLLLAEHIFEYGHRRRKWWEWTRKDKQDMLLLNNYRQDRGRIYDALSSYPGEEEGGGGVLRRVCADSVACARRLDPAMPALDAPSHLLVLYYTSARKLGWHRDDGERRDRQQRGRREAAGRSAAFLLCALSPLHSSSLSLT